MLHGLGVGPVGGLQRHDASGGEVPLGERGADQRGSVLDMGSKGMVECFGAVHLCES